jgi:dTMP kinase
VGADPGHRHRRGLGRGGAGVALTRGRFVSLEGVDGSGKSTQAGLLAEALRARGHEVVLTREPGGTRMGERVRELILDSESPAASPATEALLFAAARAELVAEVIRPALEAGAWVVADRFIDSSLAYQGAARGLGVDAVWRANADALGSCMPDLTVLLDLPVDVAWRREAHRDDRIESEGTLFQERVAAGYREVAGRFPGRFAVISAEGSAEEVHARVLARVEALG